MLAPRSRTAATGGKLAPTAPVDDGSVRMSRKERGRRGLVASGKGFTQRATGTSLGVYVHRLMFTSGGRLSLLRVVVCGVVLAVFVYSFLHLMRAGVFDEDVTGKIMVIYSMQDTLFTWKQGMFSDFASVLGALEYGRQNGAAGVRVDFYSDMYVEPERGLNWWEYFFEPVMLLDDSLRDAEGVPEVHFNRFFSRHGKLGSFSHVISGPAAREEVPYPLRAGVPMHQVRRLIEDYVKIKPEVTAKVNDMRKKFVRDGDFLIGIHYRGTDKSVINWPFVAPSYDSYMRMVLEVLERYNVDRSRLKIFLATDETEFVPYMVEMFGKETVSFSADAPRLPKYTAVGQSDGGTHKSTLFSPFLKAESAILDCLMLSTADYIIKNRSSLSDGSLAFSKNVNWTMILADWAIYSSDHLPGTKLPESYYPYYGLTLPKTR